MGRLFKKIFVFEIFYKLFIICLANPLLNEIYQTYVASRGLSFNKDIIATFISVKGIFIFIALFLCAGLLVFYEYAVIIHIISFSRENRQPRLMEVLKGSVWNFSAMKGWSIVPASFVFVLAIPFSRMAWKSTMVPSVEVPWFIQGEMTRSLIGVMGVAAILAAYFLIFLLTMFVPIYMVLKEETIGKAFVSNLKLLWALPWKWKLVFGAIGVVFYTVTPYLSWITSRKPLTYKDFDLDFAKYLVHTESFALDFGIWLAAAVINVILMTALAYFLIFLWGKYETRNQNPYPVWESDWAEVLKILARHSRSAGKKLAAKMKKKRYKALTGLLAAGLAAYVVVSAAAPVPYIHRPWVIGHRGSFEGIENTMEAVKGAYRLGCDFAEVDVQLTKDGVPVLVHDTNLWRLAGKRVNVADLTLKELQALEIRDRNHPGKVSSVPTLEEAIAFAKDSGSDMGLLIELKPSGTNHEELAKAIIALVEEYDFGDRAMFMSLYYECIYPIITAHPQWWVGYCIFGSSGDINDSVWQYDIDFIAPEENQVSYSLVYQARAHGLPVYVWTVYDVERMGQYLQMGVTGIITDYPSLARPELEKFIDKYGIERYNWKEKGYPKR